MKHGEDEGAHHKNPKLKVNLYWYEFVKALSCVDWSTEQTGVFPLSDTLICVRFMTHFKKKYKS